ncbi:hypothetical protein REPUB_Repub19eG0050900 [Reevesia pubescens]
MSAIAFVGADPLNYLSSWFNKETYLKAYEHMMGTVKGRMFWPKNILGPMDPPLVKRISGRPTKKRRREALEGKSGTKLSRVGRKMTCGFCHEEGHNKLGCPRKGEFVRQIFYSLFSCLSSLKYISYMFIFTLCRSKRKVQLHKKNVTNNEQPPNGTAPSGTSKSIGLKHDSDAGISVLSVRI